ncbi:MAG TPA: VOC family protein [Rhizomicrobium sp.]|nr:VOC family protein [Rhizomicrobium sp.]
MKMQMARVILFTNKMEAMTVFYRDVLGLPQLGNDPGWREFEAGGTTIALHSGPPSPGRKGPKIAFRSRNVARLRATLNKRGAKFGDVSKGPISLCNGRDPDGNPVQLSSR